MFTCKPYEIDSDMPIFPSSEDNHGGFEHFIVEPGCREDWVSGLLDLDALQIEKCFNIEDIAETFDCDRIKFDLDVVQPRLSKEEGKISEFPSETSQEIFTRVHGEYHFDAQQVNGAGDSTQRHQKEIQVENSGVEKQSQSILETETVVELSSISVPVLKKKSDDHYSSLDQAVEKDIHEAFENSELFINKDWENTHDLSSGFNNYSEFGSGLSLVKYEPFSDENEDVNVFSSVHDFSFGVTDSLTGSQKHPNVSPDQPMKRKRTDVCDSFLNATSVSRVEMCSIDEEDQPGQLVSQKRARKPPRRYIEESLEYEFKPFHKRCGSGKKPKDRLVQDRCPKQKWQKDFPVEKVAFEDDSFSVGCIQVPFGLPVEKECQKNNKPSPAKSSVRSSDDLKNNTRAIVPFEKLDNEPLQMVFQEDYSEDDCVTRNFTPRGNNNNSSNNIRRKRHISWTPEEVVMLVDGVAQCGVGRWTEIKRLLFSSSSHRTSVDLKDKWRNLLRASCNQLEIKEKVEQGRKPSSNYVSESILWRVKELSVLYPYPRDNRAKISCTIPAFQPRGSNALVPLSTVV